MKFVVSGVIGAIGVAAGASGAHGKWADHLAEIGRLDQWQTAVDYQLLHAAVLLAIAVASSHKLGGSKPLIWGFRLVSAGVILFSGSLYTICFTGVSRFGAITPVGGLLMIAGWLTLCFCGLKATACTDSRG